jgi:hypothetical protein
MQNEEEIIMNTTTNHVGFGQQQEQHLDDLTIERLNQLKSIVDKLQNCNPNSLAIVVFYLMQMKKLIDLVIDRAIEEDNFEAFEYCYDIQVLYQGYFNSPEEFICKARSGRIEFVSQ